MEQDKLKSLTHDSLTHGPSPIGGGSGMLMAEEGASLSSGSLRLYHLLPSPPGREAGGEARAVGCIDLYNYDPLNRRAAVGIMVATEHRRQGCGLAMLHALQELASTTYRLHTLYADIAAPNAASIALFRKAGYMECGRFKDWLSVDDRYIDTIRMQKTIS